MALLILTYALCAEAFWAHRPSSQQILGNGDSKLPSASANLPLVIWHGLGDTYDSDGIVSVGEILNATVGPTYMYSVRLSNDSSSDRSATFFGNLTTQLDTVCHDLANEPILAKAGSINAIGFSQGGQFMRGFVERCNKPRVVNLATFGSQHNGISDFQNCESSNLNPFVCAAWDGLLKSQTWSSFVQNKLVPAQYFRDPQDLDSYLNYSNFLADINNERPKARNMLYKANLAGLKKLWLYVFSEDITVVPKESGWFDEVVGSGNDANTTKLRDRKLYTEDWLGLKQLDQRGALHCRTAKGAHMQITDGLLKELLQEMYS